jgi:hypothetical protein
MLNFAYGYRVTHHSQMIKEKILILYLGKYGKWNGKS